MKKGHSIALMNPNLSVGFASLYLLLYCISLQDEHLLGLAWLLMAGFPFVLVWVVFSILKDKQYSGGSLDGEEFGYQDRKKEELKRF